MSETALAVDSMPRLAPGVRLHFDETRQAWMLLAPERVLMLDETSLDIVQRCDGATQVTALIDGLAQAYSADRAEIDGDVRSLLSGLIEKRVLQI
nr:pyrroloquinoline quinone biosynthesis peptide chaperone PqqD [uncultured Dongia sp.]